MIRQLQINFCMCLDSGFLEISFHEIPRQRQVRFSDSGNLVGIGTRTSFLGGAGRGISARDNHVNTKPDQVGGEIWEPFVFPFRPPVFDYDVRPLHVTQIAKPLAECLDEGIGRRAGP